MNKNLINKKSILCAILSFCMLTCSVQPIYANEEIPLKLNTKDAILALALAGTFAIGAYVILNYSLRALSSVFKKSVFTKHPGKTEYNNKITKLNINDELKNNLKNEASKLMPPPFDILNQDQPIIRNRLDFILSLPWGILTPDNLNFSNAKKTLDQKHFGLKEVKEKILDFIALKMRNPNSKKVTILCLVGPPGTGKTSICKSIAKCLNKKYAKISLGGVSDESTIRGHRKTYLGAMPGRIMNGLQKAGSSNPVIVLDEIDKMGNSINNGDPSAALLEVLDPKQNKEFCDHYVEIPFDLSKVMFIATANDIDKIPEALKDRIETIELSGYTKEEKLNIAKKHLLPNTLKDYNLNDKNINLEDNVLEKIVDEYSPEPGIRGLDRQIKNLLIKQARALAENNNTIVFSPKNLEQYLGKPKKYNHIKNNNAHFIQELLKGTRKEKIENKNGNRTVIREIPPYNENKQRKRSKSLFIPRLKHNLPL